MNLESLSTCMFGLKRASGSSNTKPVQTPSLLFPKHSWSRSQCLCFCFCLSAKSVANPPSTSVMQSRFWQPWLVLYVIESYACLQIYICPPRREFSSSKGQTNYVSTLHSWANEFQICHLKNTFYGDFFQGHWECYGIWITISFSSVIPSFIFAIVYALGNVLCSEVLSTH